MHRLDLRGWTPGAPVKLELIFTFPKATLALNGCCALSPKAVLAADSLAGQINVARFAIVQLALRPEEPPEWAIGQTPSVAGYIVAARSGMWRRIV